MTLRARPALALLLLLAGCAASPSALDSLAGGARALECGLRGAMLRRLPRPESRKSIVRSGDSISACALPDAAEIESACEAIEAAPIPGSSNPDNPDAPAYAFPDHKVRKPRCAFTDESGSRADCRFELAAGGAAPAPARARLTYRYRDLSNAVVHGWHVANWEADTICRPQ